MSTARWTGPLRRSNHDHAVVAHVPRLRALNPRPIRPSRPVGRVWRGFPAAPAAMLLRVDYWLLTAPLSPSWAVAVQAFCPLLCAPRVAGRATEGQSLGVKEPPGALPDGSSTLWVLVGQRGEVVEPVGAGSLT